MSKSIGFIGGGAMATGIIKGILSANTLTVEEIYVKELLPERQVYLKETYGLQLADSLKELAEKAKVLVLAVRPQDAEKAALRKLRADEFRLFLQALCDLRVVRVLRQTALRQFDQLKVAIGLQSLGVFRRSLGIKALFQLSHTDERDGKHKNLRKSKKPVRLGQASG